MDRYSSWVIVISKPAAEEVAERNLRQSGYRVYLPRYRKLLRPHGSDRRGQPSMRPLFTGYLFVNDWHGWPHLPINGTIGLMRVAGRNVELSDPDVGLIWRKEMDGGFDECRMSGVKEIRTDIVIGENVEFDFHGQRVLAVLDELTPSGQAVVRGMIFSRETVMRVDADSLSAISA